LSGRATRRTFIKSVAALGASAALATPATWAEDAKPDRATIPVKPHRIDVHHHMFPPFLQEAWKKAGLRTAPVAMHWSPEAALEQMDLAGVRTAVLSLASGGLNLPRLGVEENRRMARRVNDYAARLREDHPGRFGLFAHLPMPDIEGTLKEIEFALDVIKADGIGLNTNYGTRFLGDPDYRAVMRLLNRRKAVVYVHPNVPECCGRPAPTAAAAFTQYAQATNRTVMSLLFSGTFTRTRDVHWIFSHAGAGVPLLAERVNALAKIQLTKAAQMLPDSADFELKRLYYETANTSEASNLAALLKFVPGSQVLFGSDYPYVPVVDNVSDLLKTGLSAAQLAAIDRDNAARLMPRLIGT
jgi:predicted TIM-barrel fold metal-dependent hydrolase